MTAQVYFLQREDEEKFSPSKRRYLLVLIILIAAGLVAFIVLPFKSSVNNQQDNTSMVNKLSLDEDYPLCEGYSGLAGIGCGLVQIKKGEFCLSNCDPSLECIFLKETDTRSICSRPNPSRTMGIKMENFKGGLKKSGTSPVIIFDGKARDFNDGHEQSSKLSKRAFSASLGQPFQSAAFVDATTGSLSTLTAANTATGLKNYFLGFIVANSVNATANPTFNGNPISNYLSLVKTLKSQNFGIIVSFGGAAGTFIENTAGMTGDKMASWISQVIDLYGLTRIDMDIEGAPAYLDTAIAIRLDALKRIRLKYPNLIISATVPADYNGMNTFQTINMLQLYADNGFKFDMINFMTMYFSTLVSSSLQSTIQQSYLSGVSQATSRGFSSKFGFTMCTGYCGASPNSPVTGSVVTGVMGFAAQQSSLAVVSIWSTNNDAANNFGAIAAMVKGTPVPPVIPGYLGCYADSTAARTLPTIIYGGNQNTVENCKTLCGKAGFKLAGLQQGNVCYCGNDIPPSKLADSSCSMPCTGNTTEFCGNWWQNSVYSTGVTTVPVVVRPSGYQGCYADSTTARTLPTMIYGGNQNTVENCKTLCGKAGFKLAGLQQGNVCYCGNDIPPNKLADTSCSMPCTGNATESCGNWWQNSVYTTGVTTVPVVVRPPGYQGCYADSTTARTLPTLIYGGNQNTVENCKTLCGNAGFKLAGLQQSNVCCCGNDIPPTKLADSSCSMPCTGDSTETCGNWWQNSVYSTGVTTPPVVARPPGYQGCYADSTTARTLPTLIYGGNQNTVENCKTLCKNAGFALAGLQQSNVCYCGNVMPTTKLADSSCSMVCTGNANEFCGNWWQNSIYTTN